MELNMMADANDRRDLRTAEDLPSLKAVRPTQGIVGGAGEKQTFDVLVLEDDPVLRRTVAFSLHAEGYRVIGARDGIDALHVLESALPRGGLLGLQLPAMDGVAFVNEIRARGIDPAIIVQCHR